MCDFQPHKVSVWQKIRALQNEVGSFFFLSYELAGFKKALRGVFCRST